jgi:AAHS family 4-hydroxybenzoate transporter-like MFS transporter
MANYFLNSWMPTLFNTAGLTPEKAALASSLYHIGGTVGGLLICVLLDRFGFVVIAALFVCAAPAIAAIGASGVSYAELAPLATIAGLCVLGAALGDSAAAGLLYPTQFRSKGVGWALAIGRFGAIGGPLLGGQLIKMNLPVRQLFLAAAAPPLGCRITATDFDAKRLATDRVPSAEPSSTMMISFNGHVWARADLIVSAIQPSALKAGTKIDINGFTRIRPKMKIA